MKLLAGFGQIENWQLFLIILIFALPIGCIIHIITRNFRGGDKIVWAITILFIPILGAILYLLLGRKKKI
ncbi:MAG: PLDc N-terminal domain-containing protein [Cyclobacteriaceae bacterium]